MNRLVSFAFIIILTFTVPVNGLAADLESVMRVHFIDVGQGDSILIETPEKQNILIDGGEPEAGPDLVKYLKKNSIAEIDLMIATHPDMDHIGGLVEVMEKFPVKQIIDNGQPYMTKVYASYRMQILKETIPVRKAKLNEKVNFEDKLDIHVLNTGGNTENNNQSSIVLKLTYQDVSFLLMSDVEAEQEKRIAKKYSIDSDILKVAHHGSNSSSTLKFLQEVSPEAAIITYSMENEYGHPVNRVIKNLRKVNTQIFSTAVYGNIVIETDGKDYIILPEHQPLDGLMR